VPVAMMLQQASSAVHVAVSCMLLLLPTLRWISTLPNKSVCCKLSRVHHLPYQRWSLKFTMSVHKADLS
jgi:hypothetical protein